MIEKPWWQRLIYNTWPYIRRVVNNAFFRVVKVVRSGVKVALDQLKYG